jgi:hypothetical protein
MAADLNEFNSEEIDSHRGSKRRSYAAMGHDDASPLAGPPITASSRSTPPQTAIASERPTLEPFMTPSPSNTNSPGMASNRHFASVDNDIAKFVQSVVSLHIMLIVQPLARAANVCSTSYL